MHDYLGMDLDMSEKGVTAISMIKYLKKIFSNFPEEITKFARGKYPESPGADYLFKMRDIKKVRKSSPRSSHRFFTAV